MFIVTLKSNKDSNESWTFYSAVSFCAKVSTAIGNNFVKEAFVSFLANQVPVIVSHNEILRNTKCTPVLRQAYTFL